MPTIRRRRQLATTQIEDRRQAAAVGIAIVCWVFITWAITGILAGTGAPFAYALGLSIGELRTILWAGTAIIALGVVAAGTSFMRLGSHFWRNGEGNAFGMRMRPAGEQNRVFIRYYGLLLVATGTLLIPLGASLLLIVAQCRYMTDF